MLENSLLKKIVALSLCEKKSQSQKILKLAEELGELAQASLIEEEASGSTYKSNTSDAVIEEACDVLLCALSIACAHKSVKSLKPQQILELVQNKLSDKVRKWAKYQAR